MPASAGTVSDMDMKRKVFAALLAALCLLSPAFQAGAEEAEPAGEGIRVAFIDSGISTRHIDPAHVAEGVNFVFPESDTQDRIGHGTATAGLVLGSAEQGVEGACPEAVAVPLVVLDVYPSGVKENGGTEALCRALREAVDLGCRVINVSLSTGEDSEELREAVAYAEEKGVVIVSAVGNGGAEGAVCYPAAYDTVIAVGTADGADAANFSQNGADLLVDGRQLTVPTHRNSLRPAAVSGTSYSCALLTGFCARLLLRYPELSPAELRGVLSRMAEDILEPGFDERSGWGVLPAFPAVPEPFLDLREDWSLPGILYAVEQGIMNGVGGGCFAPDALATRAMIVTMLWRMEGTPAAEAAPGFTDVPPQSWYAGAVGWGVSAGLVSGYSPERFGPADAISREQLATILWRYAALKGQAAAAEGTALAAFEDVEAVSPWAAEALCWAVENGVVTGTGEQRLSPAAPATRAQVATILMRFAAAAGPAQTPEPEPPETDLPPEAEGSGA